MIQIYVTGGTFDKDYNFITGELYFKDSHLKDMLERGRCNIALDIKTLMMVDSLEMTEADRAIIAHNCRRAAFNRIVITHGTDTMVKTAEYLAREAIEEKTIVVTGAMVPYAFGSSSDGFFNLGSALAFAQALPAGVYVAMNGRYYQWHNVRKNRQTGFFEELNTASEKL
ncbi:MAG: asparaginase domain-containing protein [Bacteroidota bacterium]